MSEINPVWWNILSGMALAGTVVSCINIHQAIYIGVSFQIFITMIILFMSVSSVKPIIKDILAKMGNGIVLLALLIWYFVNLSKNRNYIMNNNMPDSWGLFSYFVSISACGGIIATIHYYKTKNAMYNSLSVFLSVCLALFVSIEYIIGTYFRTDG